MVPTTERGFAFFDAPFMYHDELSPANQIVTRRGTTRYGNSAFLLRHRNTLEHESTCNPLFALLQVARIAAIKAAGGVEANASTHDEIKASKVDDSTEQATAPAPVSGNVAGLAQLALRIMDVLKHDSNTYCLRRWPK